MAASGITELGYVKSQFGTATVITSLDRILVVNLIAKELVKNSPYLSHYSQLYAILSHSSPVQEFAVYF